MPWLDEEEEGKVAAAIDEGVQAIDLHLNHPVPNQFVPFVSSGYDNGYFDDGTPVCKVYIVGSDLKQILNSVKLMKAT